MQLNLPAGRITVVVLGIAQDAGVPHIGCQCPRCQAAFADPALAQYASSIAIVDTRSSPPAAWLVDATPDIKYQLNLLAGVLGSHPTRSHRINQPDAVFLTHGHMGHTAGLSHLGPEGMAVSTLTVYGPAGLLEALKQNPIRRPLIQQLDLIALEPDIAVSLAPGLAVTPYTVPHRDEIDGGTFAYLITGDAGGLLYVPDVDDWVDWPELPNILEHADVALVDASFYRRGEIPGRESIGHPPITETIEFFRRFPVRLVLTHLNHTNPVLDHDSRERALVESEGVEVAYQGQIFNL